MRAALLIGLGGVASRVLGLARAAVIALLFGRAAGIDAYTAAWSVPNVVYDFLVSGALSAALVPVLSVYAEGEEDEFWRVAATICALGLLVLLVLVGLIGLLAPLIARVLVQPSRVELREPTVVLVRLLLPAALCMGLSGLMTAILHARRAFALPSLANALLNLGIVLGAALLHERMGVASLAVGAGLGAFAGFAVQAFGVVRVMSRTATSTWPPRGAALFSSIDSRHPAVRRIMRLYAPVALGTGIALVGLLIDRRLASGYPAALATMQYATTLIQLPLGLIAAAISLAVLPTLARQSAAADDEAFRQTLALGLGFAALLVLPATSGLAAIRAPVTALLFERGAFVAQDTAATMVALLYYLPGLPAIAAAQLLLFALYARQITLAPNLAQGVGLATYLLTVALLSGVGRLGFLALVLANSAQWIVYALLLLWLLRRSVSLGGLGLGAEIGKMAIASALMYLAVGRLLALLTWAPASVAVALGAGAGVFVYLGTCSLLRVRALEVLASLRPRTA